MASEAAAVQWTKGRRATCPVCHETRAVKRSGELWSHRDLLGICDGSDLLLLPPLDPVRAAKANNAVRCRRRKTHCTTCADEITVYLPEPWQRPEPRVCGRCLAARHRTRVR